MSFLRSKTFRVSAGIGVSRVTGFLRNVMLVTAIGGTSATAAGQIFDVANTLPTNLYTLLAGGVLSSVLLPSLVDMLSDGRRGERRLKGATTFALLSGLGGTLCLMALSPFLVRVYASDWPADWLRLGTWMAIWCLPQVFFLVGFTFLAQLLNAYGSVVWAAWAPALANVVPIGGLLAFATAYPRGLSSPAEWSTGAVLLVAGGATAGSLAQAAVLIAPLLARGHRFAFGLGFRGLGSVGRGALWALAATGAGQLAFLAVSRVSTAAGARLTEEGRVGPSLNSLNTAYLLVLAPYSLLVVSRTTALARDVVTAARSDRSNVGRHLASLGCTASALIGPSTWALICLGPVVSEAVWHSAAIGEVTACLSVSLLPFSLLYVCTRVLYACGSARFAFVPQAVVAAVTACSAVVAGFALDDRSVVDGVALGIALANVLGLLVALRILGVALGDEGLRATRRLRGDFGKSALCVALGWASFSLADPLCGWPASTCLGLVAYLVVDHVTRGPLRRARAGPLDSAHRSQ